jgi:hypothetical protein
MKFSVCRIADRSGTKCCICRNIGVLVIIAMVWSFCGYRASLICRVAGLFSYIRTWFHVWLAYCYYVSNPIVGVETKGEFYFRSALNVMAFDAWLR